MDDHRDAGLLDAVPVAVVLRESERSGTVIPPRRRRAHEHTGGAPLQHPLQLPNGVVHDTRRDDRRGEDAALVLEGPFVDHPLVQGVDGGGAQIGIVTHALLDQAGQRGQHEGVLHALLVE